MKIEYATRHVIDDSKFQAELEAIQRDPRTRAQMAAVSRLLSLRLSHSIFGAMPSCEWAFAQLSDDERAALAKDAEPVERLLT